jgi:hypothetical protein
MDYRLPFTVMSTAFLILGIIIVTAPMIQDESETATFATTSNIIFRYGVSGAKHMNELNTLKGFFIKDMVNKEPAWTKLDFTQEEMDTIYDKMVDIDFFSYPIGFHPKLEGDIIGEATPFSIYYLEYRDKSRTKIVQWNDKYWAPEDTDYQNLKELARLIIELIQDKPEYKKLPEPTAGYA